MQGLEALVLPLPKLAQVLEVEFLAQFFVMTDGLVEEIAEQGHQQGTTRLPLPQQAGETGVLRPQPLGAGGHGAVGLVDDLGAAGVTLQPIFQTRQFLPEGDIQ